MATVRKNNVRKLPKDIENDHLDPKTIKSPKQSKKIKSNSEQTHIGDTSSQRDAKAQGPPKMKGPIIRTPKELEEAVDRVYSRYEKVKIPYQQDSFPAVAEEMIAYVKSLSSSWPNHLPDKFLQKWREGDPNPGSWWKMAALQNGFTFCFRPGNTRTLKNGIFAPEPLMELDDIVLYWIVHINWVDALARGRKTEKKEAIVKKMREDHKDFVGSHGDKAVLKALECIFGVDELKI
eukprot:TRINITY_DN4218_c0_g2_i1.p1 TRINITY_DN4218_c0_g2~~TRINITY_DN4218_c0_g2_i1.p1  ORF type:complete len:235 (-),score=61.37 TRINITY_DN4218_c0_g2_i1:86-790(-)